MSPGGGWLEAVTLPDKAGKVAEEGGLVDRLDVASPAIAALRASSCRHSRTVYSPRTAWQATALLENGNKRDVLSLLVRKSRYDDGDQQLLAGWLRPIYFHLPSSTQLDPRAV